MDNQQCRVGVIRVGVPPPVLVKGQNDVLRTLHRAVKMDKKTLLLTVPKGLKKCRTF